MQATLTSSEVDPKVHAGYDKEVSNHMICVYNREYCYLLGFSIAEDSGDIYN